MSERLTEHDVSVFLAEVSVDLCEPQMIALVHDWRRLRALIGGFEWLSEATYCPECGALVRTLYDSVDPPAVDRDAEPHQASCALGTLDAEARAIRQEAVADSRASVSAVIYGVHEPRLEEQTVDVAQIKRLWFNGHPFVPEPTTNRV